MNPVGGSYPWRLDSGYNTVVHLKNTIGKAVYAIVQVRYEGGTYNPERIKLAPYQTIALDLTEMRDAQEKDIRGGVMPKGVTGGQITWYEEEIGSIIGRAEVFNIGAGLASSFSCDPLCCPPTHYDSYMSPSSGTSIVGDQGRTFIPFERRIDNCTSIIYGPYDMSSSSTWSSDNTGVATVDGTGWINCVGAGSAGIKASYQVNTYGQNCVVVVISIVSGGGLFVQVPTSLTVLTVSTLPTGTSGDYGCDPDHDFGIAVAVQYQVKDQNGNPINRSDMEPQEKVTNYVLNFTPQADPIPNWSDIGPSRISTTSRFTNANGIFYDAPYGICGSTSFTATLTQQISILAKGLRYTVRTNNESVSSSSRGCPFFS
jgi:hypothetical protein